MTQRWRYRVVIGGLCVTIYLSKELSNGPKKISCVPSGDCPYLGQVCSMGEKKDSHSSLISGNAKRAFLPISWMEFECRTSIYREVQLDLTPEIKVYHILFNRGHTKNTKRSIRQHLKYFNFWSSVGNSSVSVRFLGVDFLQKER